MIRGGDGKLKGKRKGHRDRNLAWYAPKISRLVRRGAKAALHNGWLYIGLGMMIYPFPAKCAVLIPKSRLP